MDKSSAKFEATIEPLCRDDFVDAIDDPILLALFVHWEKHGGLNRLMPKSALDPTHIPKLLPHVFLMDVCDGGTTFRYRLTGTYIDERIPRGVGGKRMDEIRGGPALEHLNTLFGNAVRAKTPTLGVSQLKGESNNIYAYKRLAMPMTKDGTGVDLLLGGWTAVGAYDDGGFAKRRESEGWSPEEPQTIVSLAV